MTQKPTAGSPPQPGTGAIAHALFPAGVATRRSLVDRTDEHIRLADDVLTGRHAWFDCPPRYGVTSLIERLRQDMCQETRSRILFATCLLNAAHDATSFCDALLKGAGQLVSQTIRRPSVDAETINKFFSGIDKEIYLDDKQLHTIRFDAGPDPIATMLRIIPELDRVAHEQNCRCVFIIRDMQQVMTLRERDEILQGLKQIIELSENITWLVQGNNRYSMRQLFFDKGAILRGICRRFTLRPINASIYAQHLANAAQRQWHCFIGRKAAAMILGLTGRHPYWVNELCRRLWCSDLPPVIQDVVNEWSALVLKHRHQTSRDMERLSPNQRAVLFCLAQTPTDQPRAKSFVQRTRVSSASVGQAIKILAEQDLICLNPDGAWTIADPVLQWSLHQRTDIVDGIFDQLPEQFL